MAQQAWVFSKIFTSPTRTLSQNNLHARRKTPTRVKIAADSYLYRHIFHSCQILLTLTAHKNECTRVMKWAWIFMWSHLVIICDTDRPVCEWWEYWSAVLLDVMRCRSSLKWMYNFRTETRRLREHVKGSQVGKCMKMAGEKWTNRTELRAILSYIYPQQVPRRVAFEREMLSCWYHKGDSLQRKS